MKILVMSDSHSYWPFMHEAIDVIRPNAVIFLGDGCDQVDDLELEFDRIAFHIVGGNCDRMSYRIRREMLCYKVCGVMIYMTHGHNEGVKYGLEGLMAAARANGAAAALYGHTHEAYCSHEPDGLWVFNPGSCRSYSGSVGLMEVDNGEIKSCRILRQKDLEAMK